MGIFDRLLGNKRTPELSGAPTVRRVKTYQAESGYVYQYIYGGKRDKGRSGNRLEEFAFDVSADRKTWFRVMVEVSQTALSGWETREARSLTETERYAVSKMALMRAFDQVEAPGDLREPVVVTAQSAVEILSTLDL
ncbi:MAG: hypothetical protein IT168_19410 [Bryobacterales bacterium]|nr:hypothetical protein [Bryobacterales bacterium]